MSEALTFRCDVFGRRTPGPWKDVPAVANHAFIAHRVEVADTYRIFDYRDQDEAPRAPREEGRVPFVTAPCGKRVPGGSGLGGHKGKCKACQLKLHPDGLRSGVTAPDLTAPARFRKKKPAAAKSVGRAESPSTLATSVTAHGALAILDAKIATLTRLRVELAEALA